MPKTIDYPRTSYQGAWEVAEVVDDTGGKCAIETAARKLNRKVSGSFKAIIGSAVKFGLLTSKREFLTTTNLFRRIKHAYDKQEERIYHREAFLHPPMFNQICRKFRNRELPVHMFDVMLIREFGVEEINAQGVAKAFIDGARMAGILDENNFIADIDQLAAQQTPRKELSPGEMPPNLFRGNSIISSPAVTPAASTPASVPPPTASSISSQGTYIPTVPAPPRTQDAISNLFGLDTDDLEEDDSSLGAEELSYHQGPEAVFIPQGTTAGSNSNHIAGSATNSAPVNSLRPSVAPIPSSANGGNREAAPETEVPFSIRIQGPGIDTHLTIQEAEDLDVVEVLLRQIRRRLTI
ncbi:hypothetical protein [Hymenobacter metallilatus]|uniref:Uncharacterized protein n=1 Tax=Hymenobacter metallilatus TaxID=2493666 RepID=A0A428IZW2_9BACT|nr:hypothetical protein [Hymenobacter metallilatus]RSK25183.1 hypothetical protein EI290_17310 [Hymenobacter metallilatus]